MNSDRLRPTYRLPHASRIRGVSSRVALSVLAALAVAAGVAGLAGAFRDADNAPLFAGLGGADDHAARLEARLNVLEKQQSEQFDLISRQLAALAAQRGHSMLTPEQIQARERQREHARRMQEDPEYARQMERQRLAGLQNEFANEPMDHRWSTEARAFVAEAMASALASADTKVKKSEIDCRSSTCQMVLDIDTRYSHEDVLMYLMTDLAELLPGARLVVMPPDNGVRTINIFARREMPASPPHDDDG